MPREILSQAEIAVLREFDWAAESWVPDWAARNPPAARATQAEVDEHGESLIERGYLAVDKEGYWRTNGRGRAQYEYWKGEPR